MPHYKITYFDARSRVECIRLVLECAGQKYEQVKLSRPEWLKFKEENTKTKLAFSQCPLVEEDGMCMVQSLSIVRHFARVYDLYGSNENEKVRIDMLLDGCEDLKESYFAVVYNDKAMEAVKVFQETTLPTWCDYFETLKSKNEGNWFVGNKISVADICLFDVLYMGYRLCPKIFDKFPKLSAFMDHFATLDWYKAYIASDRRSKSVNTDKASLDNTEHPVPWLNEVTKYN